MVSIFVEPLVTKILVSQNALQNFGLYKSLTALNACAVSFEQVGILLNSIPYICGREGQCGMVILNAGFSRIFVISGLIYFDKAQVALPQSQVHVMLYRQKPEEQKTLFTIDKSEAFAKYLEHTVTEI